MSQEKVVASEGDWIEVHGHVQGEPPRHALVLEVLGSAGNEHYRVKWADDEHESIFFPGPDAMVRKKEKPAGAGKPSARKRSPA